ncbi:MAG: peptidoglycan recognition protein family protein [Pseudonocardiaceae bacterium]
MGIYVAWLADAARLTGYPVVEVAGWRTRGHGSGMRAVECVTGHHTADGPRGDYPSLHIVANGRADLAGPLSQLGLGRSGTVYVIAAGQAYHAGASSWAGFWDLNDEAIGIEAESVGTRDDWTLQQRDCYPRLVAALLFYMRRDASRFAGHREVCLPRGRKIDPAFWGLDEFRARVAWLLADPLNRIPCFATPPSTTPLRSRRRDNAGMELSPTNTRKDELLDTDVVGGWCGQTNLLLTAKTGGATVYGVYAVVDRGDKPPDVREILKDDNGRDFPQWWPMKKPLPNGTTGVIINYTAEQGMRARAEYQH